MIVGFSINKIEAEKGTIQRGNVNVNYTPKIKEVEETKSPAFEDKIARVDFEFRVDYKQKDRESGKINFEGNLLWKGKVDEVLERWDEKEELPEKIGKIITNNLYKRGITQAVGIADSMDMPSPVPLPRVKD